MLSKSNSRVIQKQSKYKWLFLLFILIFSVLLSLNMLKFDEIAEKICSWVLF